jgi:hypothetical protein
MVTVDVHRASGLRRRMVLAQDRYAGYRALWLKVVIRAIFDWVCYRDSLKLEKRKMAENAATWLFEPSKLINGLESICHSLDLSPELVREKARQMSKEQIAKIEHLERDGGGPEVKALLGGSGDEPEEA